MLVSIASINLVLGTTCQNISARDDGSIATTMTTTHFGSYLVKIQCSAAGNNIISIGRYAVSNYTNPDGRTVWTATNKHGAKAIITSNNNSLLITAAGFQLVFGFVQPTAIVRQSTCISVEMLCINSAVTSKQCSYGENNLLLSKVQNHRKANFNRKVQDKITPQKKFIKLINVYHSNGHIDKHIDLEGIITKTFPKCASHPGQIWQIYEQDLMTGRRWVTGTQSSPNFVYQSLNMCAEETPSHTFQFKTQRLRIGINQKINRFHFSVNKMFYYNGKINRNGKYWAHNLQTKRADVLITRIAPKTYRVKCNSQIYVYYLDKMQPSMHRVM